MLCEQLPPAAASSLSPGQLFVTPQTVARQAPLRRILQVRMLEWVAILFSVLRRIFLTQEWNWYLLHCRQILLYRLSHQGNPAYSKFKFCFLERSGICSQNIFYLRLVRATDVKPVDAEDQLCVLSA